MSNKSAQILVVTVFFLLALGVTMLCSTSVFSAQASVTDAYYDVKRQILWVALGAGLCFFLALFDYHWWQRTAWFWYGLAALMLVLCYVPHIGTEINGEKRWVSAELIGLRSLRFQPSELGKLAAILVLAVWYEKNRTEEKTFLRGFLYPLGIASVLILLILGEVDMGSAMILGATAFAVMFLAGANWKYLGGTAIAGMATLVAMVLFVRRDRLDRILGLLDPEAHSQGVMLQQWLAMIAFGSGGVGRKASGEGRTKMLYMPFAHTDFIFPMVGEELGLVFTLLIVLSFVLILIFGMLIALHAPDRFGKLFAFGIVLCISIQAILNIGVTTAVLPNTGLPLPFVSYGGSNVLFCLVGVGILLNIFRQGNQKESENYPRILRRKLTPARM